jgi:phosphotransacetylase
MKPCDFTFVAAISNGAAMLGVGDLGALAAKPVMEGKAALFRRFADIDAIDLEIDTRGVDFAYDGEISADVAPDQRLMRQLYPFRRLRGPAHVPVMPGLHGATIATKLPPQLGGGAMVGPLLSGLSRPLQIVSMGATVSDLVNLAALAA